MKQTKKNWRISKNLPSSVVRELHIFKRFGLYATGRFFNIFSLVLDRSWYMTRLCYKNAKQTVKKSQKWANEAVYRGLKAIHKLEDRTERYIRKVFALKRNRRRLVYVTSAVIIIFMAICMGIINNNAIKDRKELNYQIQQEQSEQVELQQSLEDTQAAKKKLEAKLKDHEATEQELRQEIDRLKDQLSWYGGTGGADNTAGNYYAYGFCTWYVKSMRPEIPNNWGNAWDWYWRAGSMGWATGLEPKVNAIAVANNYGHVALVQSVNEDGTIFITEMNYYGWNVVNGRTALAVNFRYIY